MCRGEPSEPCSSERTGGSAQADAPLTFRLARVRPLNKPPDPTYNPPIPLTIPRSHYNPPIPLTSRCPLAPGCTRLIPSLPAMLLAFCLVPRPGARLLTACRLELGTAAPALPRRKARRGQCSAGRGKRQAESRCRCGRVQDSPLLGNAWELSKLGQAREPPSLPSASDFCLVFLFALRFSSLPFSSRLFSSLLLKAFRIACRLALGYRALCALQEVLYFGSMLTEALYGTLLDMQQVRVAKLCAPARNGIPHGTVSHTARYPTRHGIPPGTVSHTARYLTRHGIPHGTVSARHSIRTA